VKLFSPPRAFQEYLDRHAEDRKAFKKINDLIKDIQRNGLASGTGKPEPLKHVKAFSRRIDKAEEAMINPNEGVSLLLNRFCAASGFSPREQKPEGTAVSAN